jgi:hypothetical protein
MAAAKKEISNIEHGMTNDEVAEASDVVFLTSDFDIPCSRFDIRFWPLCPGAGRYARPTE